MSCRLVIKRLNGACIAPAIYKCGFLHCLTDKYIARTCSSQKSNVDDFKQDVHYFGYEEVSASEKRERVQALFHDVADKYDLMNDVMSFGIHRLWKDYFLHALSPVKGTKLLDVAGGTGDIAFRFLQATLDKDSINIDSSYVGNFEQDSTAQAENHVIVFDMNDKMLSICKERAKAQGFQKYLKCVQGNAEELPFPDNSFDIYTIATGIRNVVHKEKALSEAFRVLKPGGRFLCLEFSEVRNPIIKRLYDKYSEDIIPVLGQLIAGNWKAYQYLVESIRKFPNQEEFGCMIEDAGFSIVTYENLMYGITAIHSAYKL